MRKISLLAAGIAAAALLSAPSVFAAGNLAKQTPIEVRVNLGKDGVKEHRYHPDKLTFETGKLYKLVVHNPSNSKHYFTSYGFASRVYTRKVQVMDDLGKGAKAIAEIKGGVREVEILPGGTLEWWLVPIATGVTDVFCHIKDKDGKTHAEKGMKATITII